MKLIVLIPAFDEENNIQAVIDKIPKHIEEIADISVIVIDDGSEDKTAEVARLAGARVISLPENQGVGRALQAGIDHSLRQAADIVVSIDADGQFNPEEIKILIKPIIDNKADLVVGDRFSEGKPDKMPAAKYWGNQAMNRLVSYLTGQRYSDVSCGFRAYGREALLNLNLFGRFTYTQESFLNLAFKHLRILQPPVKVKYFKNRKSRVAKNLFTYTLKTITIIMRSFVYYKPLRFFGYPGISCLTVGIGFIIFLFNHWLLTNAFSPYKAYGFIGSGLMLFGLLLVGIGLFADMIDKIRQIQEKLLYYEKKRVYNK